MKVSEIHELFVNGQNKQAVKQIKEYGLYDFWPDYGDYLFETYETVESRYVYFQNAVIAYHRITNR